MTRPEFKCNVCGSILGSRFSLIRHAGIKHLSDINGKRISTSRQDYLRMQSAKHYVPIGDRKLENKVNLLDCNGDRRAEAATTTAAASPNNGDTGNQFALLVKEFEEYLRKMMAKADSSQSEELHVEAVKTKQQHGRRNRQKVKTTDRKQRKQLSNWTCY